jgi:hypothetical protein
MIGPSYSRQPVDPLTPQDNFSSVSVERMMHFKKRLHLATHRWAALYSSWPALPRIDLSMDNFSP